VAHSRASTPPNAGSSSKQGRTPKALKNGSIELPDISIGKYKLSRGNVIKPGDTVELQDHSRQQADAMHSGDFLRVKFIIMNMATDEVRLRGHRMRRTKYLGQIFDCKCQLI
jgi:DNA (cytosine-5)-methyltransferase 1